MVRKMLVIDDHPLMVSALQALVRTLAPAVECCSASGMGAALALLATESGIDLALLDLTLDDACGMQGLAALRAAAPELPVVVLSAHDDPQDLVEAVDLGAMGYISKRAGQDELVRALGIVMGGGVYIPAALVPGLPAAARAGMLRTGERAVEGAAAAVRSEAPVAGRPGPSAMDGHHGAAPGAVRLEGPAGSDLDAALGSVAPHGLTPRQAEVLKLLLRGLSNKLIARELGLSVETVKDHVAAVLRALGVSSRTQAVLVVSGHGLPTRPADAVPPVAIPQRLR